MEQRLYQIRRDRDTIEPVKCPACNEEMLKVYIPELKFHVDLCVNGCGGIFFDNRELETIRTPDKDVSELMKFLENKNFKEVNEKDIRICGCCHSKMLKMGAGTRKIEIDVCPNCNGKFLDNGELEQIREAFIGTYEKSVVEYALKHPQSFSVICSEIMKQDIDK